MRVYIGDCNNHCIRVIQYDVGDAVTVEFKGIPAADGSSGIDNDETEGTTTNKSGVGEDEGMPLECDGN